MIRCQHPFAKKSPQPPASPILSLEPAPLARFSKDVPAELERIVSKALHKNPDERYQTAKDLLIDLRHLRDELEFQHRLERSVPPRSMDDQSITASGTVPTRVDTTEQRATPTNIDIQKPKAEATSTSIIARFGKTARSRTGLIVLGVLIVAAAAGWFIWRTANVKWAQA